MFNIGDRVQIVDTKCWGEFWGISYIKGIDKKRNYIVTRTVDYRDGSQQLWVKAPLGDKIRGPYCSLRFKSCDTLIEYKPNQTGDTDDDI